MYRTDHLARVPQMPDEIAAKFRADDDLELTRDEQQIADGVIREATDILRDVQLAERLAMQYGKTWRKEVWIAADDFDSDY